jgi:hypothetical protein
MKRIRALILGSLLCFACGGATAAGQREWTFGTEFDLVPFLNDGYYVSAIAGKGRLRGRLVSAHLTVPAFATDDAFEDNDLSVVAGILDVYFKDGFSGWWLGPGFEGWEGDVTEKASGLRQSYQTTIFTVGGGYTWKFSRHFYLNPWAAVHFPIGGDREISFTSSDFEIKPTPEASVKLGIEF